MESFIMMDSMVKIYIHNNTNSLNYLYVSNHCAKYHKWKWIFFLRLGKKISSIFCSRPTIRAILSQSIISTDNRDLLASWPANKSNLHLPARKLCVDFCVCVWMYMCIVNLHDCMCVCVCVRESVLWIGIMSEREIEREGGRERERKNHYKWLLNSWWKYPNKIFWSPFVNFTRFWVPEMLF